VVEVGPVSAVSQRLSTSSLASSAHSPAIQPLIRRSEHHRYALNSIATYDHSHTSKPPNGQAPASKNIPAYMQQPNHHAYTQRQTKTPNAKSSHPPSYPSISQHELTLHTTAQTQHNMQMNPSNTITDVPNRQRHLRLSSSREDADGTHHASNND
jgi:hypothetical protein